MVLNPLAAPVTERPIPVFPDVGSTTICPF